MRKNATLSCCGKRSSDVKGMQGYLYRKGMFSLWVLRSSKHGRVILGGSLRVRRCGSGGRGRCNGT